MAHVTVPQVSADLEELVLAKALRCEAHRKLGWYHGRANPFRPVRAFARFGRKGFFGFV